MDPIGIFVSLNGLSICDTAVLNNVVSGSFYRRNYNHYIFVGNL